MVSVIIPTYNRCKLLAQTVQSVLEQTYQELELIVIDHGSSDSTESRIGSIQDSRVKYINIANDGFSGPATPRNCGLREAQGEFVAFCDDDDIWTPNKIEQQLNCFKRYKNVDLVASQTLLYDGKSCLGRSLKSSDCTFVKYSDLIYRNRLCTSSVIIRREAVKKAGFFDERLLIVEDFDYWLRVLRENTSLGFIYPEPLVYYRVHSGGICQAHSWQFYRNNFRNHLTILKKHRNLEPKIIKKATLFYRRFAYGTFLKFNGIASLSCLFRCLLSRNFYFRTKVKLAFKFFYLLPSYRSAK